MEARVSSPALLAMRLLLTLQYRGTAYAGWQAQSNATGVQQVVEGALTTMFGQFIRIEGASRTDSGVHALAQRAHADVPFEIATRGVVRGLNDLLPADVRILAAEYIADDFNCRYRARVKTYEYRIWNDEVADVFAAETHAHVPHPLDAVAMHEAVQTLRGEHDFRAFTVAEPEVSSTTRTVSDVAVTRTGRVVTIRISADGFLRYMVRRIAGSLIEVGRGKLDRSALAQSLEPAFAEARWTAPAKGLTLVDIHY
jgi:tRNA pseudouridine38-40 synthase